MNFNPIAERRSFIEFNHKFLLSTKYDSSRPMGNVALNELNSVLSAWLVGFSVEVEQFVSRALGWLDMAIANDEELGDAKNFHRMRLSWARSLGMWMLNGSDAIDSWQDAARHLEMTALADRDVWSKRDFETARLDDYLVICLNADKFEDGILEFEKYHGNRILVNKVPKPREVGYLMCRKAVGRPMDEEHLLALQHAMLRANLDEQWLGKGQFIRAATWLKAIYRDANISPLQTVLKAYEDMSVLPSFQTPI